MWGAIFGSSAVYIILVHTKSHNYKYAWRTWCRWHLQWQFNILGINVTHGINTGDGKVLNTFSQLSWVGWELSRTSANRLVDSTPAICRWISHIEMDDNTSKGIWRIHTDYSNHDRSSWKGWRWRLGLYVQDSGKKSISPVLSYHYEVGPTFSDVMGIDDVRTIACRKGCSTLCRV